MASRYDVSYTKGGADDVRCKSKSWPQANFVEQRVSGSRGIALERLRYAKHQRKNAKHRPKNVWLRRVRLEMRSPGNCPWFILCRKDSVRSPGIVAMCNIVVVFVWWMNDIILSIIVFLLCSKHDWHSLYESFLCIMVSLFTWLWMTFLAVYDFLVNLTNEHEWHSLKYSGNL